jgi:hypothetical protein
MEVNTYYRVGRWCNWHRPDHTGTRPSDLRPAPQIRALDAPACVIPDCHRVREVHYRPFDFHTKTFVGQPVRYMTCAFHRRLYGTKRWRLEIPPDELDALDAEATRALAESRRLRAEWKAQAVEAWRLRTMEQDEYYRRVGLYHLVGKSGAFHPQTFWESLPGIDRQDIGKRWAFARQYARSEDAHLKILFDKWTHYAQPQTDAKFGTAMPPIASYAPTLEQWRDIFAWLDTTPGGFDPLAEDAPTTPTKSKAGRPRKDR